MKIVLDTHIVLMASGGQLSESRVEQLEDPSNSLLISAITLWEIAKLFELGRIKLRLSLGEFIDLLCHHPRYVVVPFGGELLERMVKVAASMHRDPADQLIVATALVSGSFLMTDDAAIRRRRIVRVL